MLRTLRAFVLAPFPAALFESTVVGLWPKKGAGIFEHPASMFVAICLYFYIAALLLGLPAWLVVRRRSRSLRTYMLLGLGIAITPLTASLIVMSMRGHGSLYTWVYDLMLFGLGGIAAGALFWRGAVRQRRGLRSKA